MARLQRIEEIVNGTIVPTHVKIMPRGLPTFVDSLLRGTARFAKRTGNSVSVLNTDNTYRFATAAQKLDTKVEIAATSKWIHPGTIVSLGPSKELHLVDDVSDTTVFLKNQLRLSYSTLDSLLLYAYPLLVAVDAAKGDTVITVKSHYKMGNGDVFAYLQTHGLIQSITETRATEAVYLGTTADPFNTYLYYLYLEKPLGRDIQASSTAYMRAYPAYFSPVVRVPNALFTAEPIGPFLVDLFGGRLLEGKTPKETLAIKTINRTGAYVLGNTSVYVTVPKNTTIFERPIAAHAPIFWDLAEGVMRMTPNRTLMKVNEKGQFSVGLKCVPNIPSGQSWNISVKVSEDCTIRWYFNPYPFQEFSFLAGTTTTVTVSTPVMSDPIDSLEINILANSPQCEVQLSGWTPASNTIETMEYSIVVEAMGEATYQTTGLLIKPYFMGPEFLKTTWDSGATFDSGKVFF